MSTTEIIRQIFALPENQQWQVVLGVLHKLQDQQAEAGLASPGEPMSLETFKQRLAKAERDIVAGRVYTTDEVRKRLNTWK
jgi:hypothetical protein